MKISSDKIEEMLQLLRQRFPNWENFDDQDFKLAEIDYKRRTIVQAKSALKEEMLKSFIDSRDYEGFISSIDEIGSDNNLLYRAVPLQGDLGILYQSDLDKPSFCDAFYNLLHGPEDSPERLEKYIAYVKLNNLPNKWTFPTYFLFVCHPESEMFVKPTAMKSWLSFMGGGIKYSNSVSSGTYRMIKDMAQGLLVELRDYSPKDMVDIQSLMWVCVDVLKGGGGDKEDGGENADVNYWKIAPGENAWNWEACKEGKFIAIGWDYLGDMANISRKDFDNRVDKLLDEHEDLSRAKLEQVWVFTHMKKGDCIVANNGTKVLLGIGEVVGSYSFVKDIRHGHRMPVNWIDVTPRKIEQGGWRRTIVKLNKNKFEALRNSTPIIPQINPPYSLQDCSKDTGIKRESLNRWINAIERKGQAIIYGPPGTGKTFVAEHLARHLTSGSDGISDLVQFHPAYAYEDFIQGIRPKADSKGQLDYPVVHGRFLEFCTKTKDKNGKCVLIIDEINRANLARVFGELMYLMEYRDRQMPLAGGGTFEIPSNVRIIGTMNTADRSIALVDHALRRRFAFIELMPDYEILKQYHSSSSYNVDPLVTVLHNLNRQIGDRHYEVGITYFLRKDLPEQIEDIWRMEIEPYLREYFYDQPDKANEFSWEQVKRSIVPE